MGPATGPQVTQDDDGRGREEESFNGVKIFSPPWRRNGIDSVNDHRVLRETRSTDRRHVVTQSSDERFIASRSRCSTSSRWARSRRRMALHEAAQAGTHAQITRPHRRRGSPPTFVLRTCPSCAASATFAVGLHPDGDPDSGAARRRSSPARTAGVTLRVLIRTDGVERAGVRLHRRAAEPSRGAPHGADPLREVDGGVQREQVLTRAASSAR